MDAQFIVVIIITVIIAILLIAVNFYLMVLYCHPEDKGWGTHIFCKILVVLGTTLAWSQSLMVPLDVTVSKEQKQLQQLWFAIYISILLCVTILFPLAIFMYETDQDKTLLNRILTSLCLQVGTLIICSLVLFISWNFLKYADIPYQYYTPKNAIYRDNTLLNVVVQEVNQNSNTFTVTTSLYVYCMAALSFIGWIFLVFFGGVGLVALPADFIFQFINRPRAVSILNKRKSSEAMQKKKLLMTSTENLLEEAKQVKVIQKEGDAKQGIWKKFKHKKHIQKKFDIVKSKFFQLQQQIEIFKLELKYADVNPIKFWLKLFLGVIFAITSFLWIMQILFGYLITKNGNPLIPFINNLLIYMQQNNAGFITTFIYSYMILYILWSSQKGLFKFGVQIPWLIRFHPMKQFLVKRENGTWMNSFLFNIIMMMITSVAVTQLGVICFAQYARLTSIFNLFGLQINYLRFFKYLYDNKVFVIALLVMVPLSIIYHVIKGRDQSQFQRKLKEIRNKKR